MAITDQSRKRSRSLTKSHLDRLDQILTKAENRESSFESTLKSLQDTIVDLGKSHERLKTTMENMEKTIDESKQREADLVKRVSKLENLCMYIYAVGTVLVAVGMLTTWAINTGKFFTGGSDKNDKNVPQDIFMYAPLDRGKHHQLPERVDGGNTHK